MEALGPELEPEMEALLARVDPDFARKVQGATTREIAELEKIAGRPLPRYYRWFLWRMGRKMGPFAWRLDFSARTVLARSKSASFKPDPRFLLIALGTDPLDPLSLAYDLDRPLRDDARVCRFDGEPNLDDLSAETLRELHADRILLTKTKARPQWGGGVFFYEPPKTAYPQPRKTVAARLRPVMTQLGFTSPIETGPYRVLWERPDAALVASSTLANELPEQMGFHLGAGDDVEVQKILKTVTAGSGLRVDYFDWDPPLT